MVSTDPIINLWVNSSLRKSFFLPKLCCLHLNPQKTWKIQFSTFNGFLRPKIKKGICEKLICFSLGIYLTKNKKNWIFFYRFFGNIDFSKFFENPTGWLWGPLDPLFWKKFWKSKGTFVRQTFQELSNDTNNLMVGPYFDQEIQVLSSGMNFLFSNIFTPSFQQNFENWL